jgi:hypothetical protein
MQSALLRLGHLQGRMEAWAGHGAALGLTYTFPLLDRRMIEFALSLPGRMFFQEGWKRWLYRKSMIGLLPDVVLWNPFKYDNAALRQLNSVRREPVDLYREPLLGRLDNPLIDVGVILAAQDRWRRLQSSTDPAASDTPAEYIRGWAWLAFTRVLPA